VIGFLTAILYYSVLFPSIVLHIAIELCLGVIGTIMIAVLALYLLKVGEMAGEAVSKIFAKITFK
jgi:hypothetical protein